MTTINTAGRFVGDWPRIGIRPAVDGRMHGVRESLEEQTRNMGLRTAKLISDNLCYPDGTPVEAAYVMGPDDGSEPSIYEDFRGLLPENELERLGRFEFYDMARGPDTALAIATGEQRLYANILLTIGVVMPE